MGVLGPPPVKLGHEIAVGNNGSGRETANIAVIFGDEVGGVNTKIPFVPASNIGAFSEGIFGATVIFFCNGSL